MLRRRVIMGVEDKGQGWITATYYYPSSFYGKPDGKTFRPILDKENDDIIEKMECVEPRPCTIYPPDTTGKNGYTRSWSIKSTTERFKIRFYFKDKAPKDISYLFSNRQGIELESIDFRGCNMDKVSKINTAWSGSGISIYTDSSWKAVSDGGHVNLGLEQTVYYSSKHPLSAGFKKAMSDFTTYIALD